MAETSARIGKQVEDLILADNPQNGPNVALKCYSLSSFIMLF